MVDNDLRLIPIVHLVEPYIILRPVRKSSVEYLHMRDSLGRDGFINPIAVRPAKIPGKFEIIDGLYRYNSSLDLGFTEIPCLVKHGVSDDDVLKLQIEANAVRIETRPVEYSQHLQRIMDTKPGMTFAELATIINRPAPWVKNMLGLLELKPEVQVMVDRGELSVSNAFQLGKLPSSLRDQYTEDAVVLSSAEFKPLISGVIKAYRECIHQGRMDTRYIENANPVAHLRNLKQIREEFEASSEGALVIANENCQSMMDAWYAALKWVMHLDERSIEEVRNKRENKVKRRRRLTKKGSTDENLDHIEDEDEEHFN